MIFEERYLPLQSPHPCVDTPTGETRNGEARAAAGGSPVTDSPTKNGQYATGKAYFAYHCRRQWESNENIKWRKPIAVVQGFVGRICDFREGAGKPQDEAWRSRVRWLLVQVHLFVYFLSLPVCAFVATYTILTQCEVTKFSEAQKRVEEVPRPFGKRPSSSVRSSVQQQPHLVIFVHGLEGPSFTHLSFVFPTLRFSH